MQLQIYQFSAAIVGFKMISEERPMRRELLTTLSMLSTGWRQDDNMFKKGRQAISWRASGCESTSNTLDEAMDR